MAGAGRRSASGLDTGGAATDSLDEGVNSQIFNLAAEVAESANDKIPTLLLKLKEILKGPPLGSKELQKLKEDIYYYDLIQYCVLVLRQDYNNIPGSWSTAVELAEIVSTTCVDLDPKEEAEEFYDKVLPSAADNLMLLARHLQARFLKAVEDNSKQDFLHYFHNVTNSLCWLLGGHIQLIQHVFQSDHLLQLLLTDDIETGAIMVSVLLGILQVNRTVLFSVEEKNIRIILDELIYKLFATSNPVIGSTSIKVMLLIVESHPPTLKILCTSYKGLCSLLSKQWTGRGFDKELSQLLDLLYAGSTQGVSQQKSYRAACLIQAAWRAYQTRKRVKNLPKVVTTLQRSFRAKREQEMHRLEKMREEEELKCQLQLRRHRALREFRQRQLSLLEIVPASEMDKYLQEERERSALLIQKVWLGYRQRKAFNKQKQALKEFRAAVIVQRAVLKFLNKRRNLRSCITPWQGLTDTQRLELRAKVDAHVKLHPVSQESKERANERHSHAQEMLGQYLMRRNLERKSEQRQEALLAQINTDIELLMSKSADGLPVNLLRNAPGLKEATKEDTAVFSSRSVPVAARARQSHNTMLQFTRGPWWKKLGDEFQDPEMIYAQDLDFDLVL
ncbi:IQ calmodulin-binding motif-containing protein 1 isoform X1 [Carcharodon carcharias]|uniref:IQ calmodulin-binding motif-containing protein 1 isoform X1 n=1 Tax=Carcharodon carcharias TaxID=13397 RepID=UPI001B7EBC7E|nr:IQ calmodulin-binding motif-containing protein 1 isoform X1 [Carcharodon carcharias]XP_041056097.1 IQ calmodulin-binding motif-containing protein 1 isoform X1 [Carcharodon carcharias]XP_041056098.1 IQ calmodulin-binding motif-containing protein 1 isoform X1 [Carcharodon carcharias]